MLFGEVDVMQHNEHSIMNFQAIYIYILIFFARTAADLCLHIEVYYFRVFGEPMMSLEEFS